MEKSNKIWMDGELVPWEKATVHVMTHTLHYGLGVFEGIRCYKTGNGSAVFRLKDHIDRLFRSAHIMGIKVPFSNSEIFQAVKETIKSNELESCYIRPLIFLGDNKRGLNCKGVDVHVAIAVWPWGSYLGDDGIEKGISVQVSSFTRHHVNITMTKAKTCGNYVNSILAKREAVENGFDEALLLDPAGNIAEGSGENIFIIRNGRLKTPTVQNVLEGITRGSVIEIAADCGLPLVEENFSRDELYIADEAFFCGTAAELTPIREVDRRTIGTGAPGNGTKKIQKAFFDAVYGRDERYRKWLDFI
ncbi:MAG: branched-chain amino acid transaminase [Nitrospinota bacterium]